jgi:hypothetical protein
MIVTAEWEATDENTGELKDPWLFVRGMGSTREATGEFD